MSSFKGKRKSSSLSRGKSTRGSDVFDDRIFWIKGETESTFNLAINFIYNTITNIETYEVSLFKEDYKIASKAKPIITEIKRSGPDLETLFNSVIEDGGIIPDLISYTKMYDNGKFVQKFPRFPEKIFETLKIVHARRSIK